MTSELQREEHRSEKMKKRFEMLNADFRRPCNEKWGKLARLTFVVGQVVQQYTLAIRAHKCAKVKH